MPEIPTGSRFINRAANTSTPSSNPVFMGINSLAAPGAALQNLGQAGESLGSELMQAATMIQQQEDALSATDAVNNYHKRAREYTEGKRQLIGANAIGLSRVATADLEGDYTTTLESLPSSGAKDLFKKHAFGVKETFLNTVASHELQQIEKYRTDTVNAAFQNAAEDIRLSTGDPKVVADVISKYEEQLTSAYAGQDVGVMKQQHRALLEKAGREADNRFAETRAFDVVRQRFTNPETGEMDYAKAKNYLLDNPENSPEIAKLTIQQREQLSNIIWSDGIRAKAQKEESQAQVAGTMWASYDKLIRGLPMNPDEPQTIAEWHTRAQQLTSSGQMKAEVLKTAISYTKAEQIQERQTATALEVERRRAISDARARRAEEDRRVDRERSHNPLMMSNVDVLARMTEKITRDPSGTTISEIWDKVGTGGLSIKDAEDLSKIVSGAPGKAWSSPTGRVVQSTLSTYRNNSTFSGNADTVLNATRYNDTVTYMQQWLLKHPDATPAEANTEILKMMYQYRSGWIRKMWDEKMGNPRIYGGGEK